MMTGIFRKMMDGMTGNSRRLEDSSSEHGVRTPSGDGSKQDGVVVSRDEELRQDARMKLVDASRRVEEELRHVERRTNDPVILAALTQSWRTLQESIKMAMGLDSPLSTSDLNRLVDRVNEESRVISDARGMVEPREDRTAGARYSTRIHGYLHETKEVLNTDQLLYAMEDLFRNLPREAPVPVFTVMIDPVTGESRKVEGLSIDWGQSDGDWQVIMGPGQVLPLPRQDGLVTDSGLELEQPDELGVGVTEDEVDGVDLEGIVEAIDAIRHDDVREMVRLKRDEPWMFRVANVADGLMASWYDSEEARPSIKEAALKAVQLVKASEREAARTRNVNGSDD